MTDLTPPKARPVIVGANHRSSTMMMRDRIFVEDQRVPLLLDALCQKGIAQVILLSTCDRVEAIGMSEDPVAFQAAVLEIFAQEGECDIQEVREQTYLLSDDEALEHLFRVTASLDSLMIGEPQILGQVKHAHRMAMETDHVRADLETCMQAAYATAKRVRTETKIGEGPIGMSTSAVQIARDLFGDLSRCRVLLVGVGDMGEMIARDLLEIGVASLTLTHPRAGRGDALARELGAHIADFDDFPNQLAENDIVLTAVASRRFRLDKDIVKAALKARRHKPMFIVDAGVPGDVEPQVEELDDAFVYGLSDLEDVALKGRAGREKEADLGAQIVKEEVARFIKSKAERAAVPTLSRLRDKFERERQKALSDANGDGEKATHLLVNRLLHDPSDAMRRIAAEDETAWARLEFALERLFDLNDEEQSS